MIQVKRGQPIFTFAVLAGGAAAFSMLQSILSPVLPTIQEDLNTSRSAVAWILIAWLLSAAVATPILGKVGDMIGKARTLLIGLAAIATGSLVAALSPDLVGIVAGRIIQGLGGAIFPLAFGIVRDEFPAEKVPSAVGILSAIIAVGGGLGAVLAGPIVDVLGWRWLFWLPMVIVVLIGILARSSFRSRPIVPAAASTGWPLRFWPAGFWLCCCRSAKAPNGAGPRPWCWGFWEPQ
jgi:MFS family permease